MTTYQLKLRTRSPLVIAARHAAIGGATQTLDYIPGSVLRGALAAALLGEGHRVDSTIFQSLFVRNLVRFGNLYPSQAGIAAASWPLPATAWSCKIHEGFLPEEGELPSPLDGHGVMDTLASQLADTWSQHERCTRTRCGCQREPIAGYYVQKKKGTYVRPQPDRRLITRTAIDGRWGSARSSYLYTVEAIEEDQDFIGFIHASKDASDAVLAAFQRKGRSPLRLGLGRSRGLGEVEIVGAPSQISGHLGLDQPLSERCQRPELNNGLHKLTPDRFAFSITLYSDAILPDDFARYQSSLNDSAWRRLVRFAGQPPSGSTAWPQSVRYAWGATAIRPVYNWRFAAGWGKRSSEEMAVARGSVFVFTAEVAEQPGVLALLEQFEANGIGRRRAEGFGEIVVGHPWHQEEVLR